MLTTLENLRERGDHRRNQLANARGTLYVASFVQILVIDETQEFGMLTIVIPDEMRQLRHGLHWCNAIQIERLFGLGERGKCVLQHGREQLFLAAEVVIQHSLVGFGTTGYLVDTRAKQAARSKFL